jgi:hypothetical protein
MSVDRLSRKPVRRFTFTYTEDDGALVARNPGAAEAHLDEVRKRHPERVRPGLTEEQRTLLTASKAFARYGRGVRFESRGGVVFGYLPRFDIPRQRGTSRAVRSMRRVHTASSSGTDPPRLAGDDLEHAVGRVCLICGGSIEHRRRQAKTCDGVCRERLYRSRRNGHNGNGNGGAEIGISAGVVLSARRRAALRDRIARIRLEHDGGYAAVERRARDLERAVRERAVA